MRDKPTFHSRHDEEEEDRWRDKDEEDEKRNREKEEDEEMYSDVIFDRPSPCHRVIQTIWSSTLTFP
jgi:hypothetical protein